MKLVRELAGTVIGAILIVFALYALGAALGVIAVGFRSVCGC